MNRDQFARKLIEVSKAERRQLLTENTALCDVELGKSLQNLCYEVWTSEPQKVSVIAETLDLLGEFSSDKAEIEAIGEWTRAIEFLVKGELQKCVEMLDKSAKSFNDLGKTHSAANTQISKLYALALLGRYDEAVACGLRAREIFLLHGDIYSVGKIEHNIGNLYWRRDFYRESEPYLTSAHEHFQQINDVRQLAMVENCQAFVKALQNDFRAAESIYETALRRVKTKSLLVTEAEIETGLSNLYLFQGKYDRALEFLESSRRKYEDLAMPQQLANTELEIADVYLEINFLREAVENYQKAAGKFSALEMQAESGRCLLNLARSLFALGDVEKSKITLERAETLFLKEGNQIQIAAVLLLKGQIHRRENDLKTAKKNASDALEISVSGENLRYELAAKWLLSEIYRDENLIDESRRMLLETLDTARRNVSPIEYLCLISLGKIAVSQNNLVEAETYFRQAVNLIENSRTTLAVEEFRVAFAADKLLPYQKLVETNLRRKDFPAAFEWLERSRSRTLFEAMNAGFAEPNRSEDAFENALLEKQTALREELNWLYSRLNRQKSSGLEAREKKTDLRRAVLSKEKKLAEISRRLTGGESNLKSFQTIRIEDLQKNLNGATLVEFFAVEDKISAFVITEEKFEVYENLAGLAETEREVRQFLFQIKTGRLVAKLDEKSRQIAEKRFHSHARKLYESLLKPLAINSLRLAIVPFGALHYLPFQSLYDGAKYVVERFELTTAPSAAIFQKTLNKNPIQTESALLIGVSDEFNPAVKREIERLARLFPKAERLIDERATFANLAEFCGQSDIIHLACHGKFRPDNPMFSALELYDENLTVGDVRKLNLTNKLIVLSACETGLNRVEPGEELIGLTRGFLSAGASSLVMSLWTVDDDSTLVLMSEFYKNLCGGENPSSALRQAQIRLSNEKPHPYFWSAFVVCGQF